MKARSRYLALERPILEFRRIKETKKNWWWKMREREYAFLWSLAQNCGKRYNLNGIRFSKILSFLSVYFIAWFQTNADILRHALHFNAPTEKVVRVAQDEIACSNRFRLKKNILDYTVFWFQQPRYSYSTPTSVFLPPNWSTTCCSTFTAWWCGNQYRWKHKGPQSFSDYQSQTLS